MLTRRQQKKVDKGARRANEIKANIRNLSFRINEEVTILILEFNIIRGIASIIAYYNDSNFCIKCGTNLLVMDDCGYCSRCYMSVLKSKQSVLKERSYYDCTGEKHLRA